MRKLIFSLVAVFGITAHGEVIGRYEFGSGSGVTIQGENLTFSDVTRVGVTTVLTTPQFSSSGWSKNTTIDTSQYVQFTFQADIAASSGFVLSGITFDHRNVLSNNGKSGPTSGQIRVFIGAANPAAGATARASVGFTPAASFSSGAIIFGSPINVAQSDVVTVRFYGWGADPSQTGMMDFDNIQVDGVAPFPNQSMLL